MKIIKIAQQTISIDYNRLLQMIQNQSFCSDPTQHPAQWANTVTGVIYDGITNTGYNNREQNMSTYHMLTNNQGKNSPLHQLYESAKSTATVADGGWTQWDPMGKGWRGPHDNRENLNFYFSIEKTPENLQKFLQHLPTLTQQVTNFAVKNNSRVSFKIPGSIGTFAKHNDSLKVYFNNLSLKDEINQFVTQSLSNAGISTGTRTHNFGQDIGKESFGLRLAMRAQAWVQQAVQEGHDPKLILEGFKRLEGNFFKDVL
jgi:hypothetical protein